MLNFFRQCKHVVFGDVSAALIFMCFIGMTIGILALLFGEALARYKKAEGSPVHFSLKYLLGNNILRIALAFIFGFITLVFVTVKFTGLQEGYVFLISFGIGLLSDGLGMAIKKALIAAAKKAGIDTDTPGYGS